MENKGHLSRRYRKFSRRIRPTATALAQRVYMNEFNRAIGRMNKRYPVAGPRVGDYQLLNGGKVRNIHDEEAV